MIVGLGKDYGRTGAQVCLKWALQRGMAVIPKSNNAGRIAQNLDVWGFELKKSDMERISFLNKDRRFNDAAVFCKNRYNAFVPLYE